MATKTVRLVPTNEPVVTETQTTDPVDVQLEADQLVVLIAEQRRIADAIKEAKARLPQQTPLERVIERQTKLDLYIPKTIANRVRARVKAGQPFAEAWHAVTEQALSLARQFYDEPTDTSDK